jgi:hypothetical protein
MNPLGVGIDLLRLLLAVIYTVPNGRELRIVDVGRAVDERRADQRRARLLKRRVIARSARCPGHDNGPMHMSDAFSLRPGQRERALEDRSHRFYPPSIRSADDHPVSMRPDSKPSSGLGVTRVGASAERAGTVQSAPALPT